MRIEQPTYKYQANQSYATDGRETYVRISTCMRNQKATHVVRSPVETVRIISREIMSFDLKAVANALNSD